MAEVTARGYQALRKGIHDGETKEDFKHIEILDEADARVLLLDVSDPRVSITSDAGANPYKIQVVLSGDDADITTPQILAGSRLWVGTEAGMDVTAIESFTQATLEEDEDEVTVIHHVEIPEIE